jgi:hypothetical protein
MLALAWTGYVNERCGGHYLKYDTLWVTLYRNAHWPCWVALALAIASIFQRNTRRILSVVSIGIVFLAYFVVLPHLFR